MSGWLFVHVFALGVWMGCVTIEAILETFAHRDAALRAGVARIHFWIDMLAEIPAFTLVAVSGVALFDPTLMQGPYALMVIAGAVAIAVNVLCVLPVVRRRQVANTSPNPAGDVALSGQTRWIFAAFGVGLPFGLAALYGGLRHGGLL